MAASEAKPALEGVDLIKHYPASGGGRRRGRVVHAVDGVSVALWPGRTLGVVGESGSGKSTVAKLLSLLVTPTSGTIRLDGEAVDPRRAEAVRAYHGEVQMVFQDPFASLNPAKSIEYILSRPLYVHGRARTSRQAYEILTELLTSVGLTPPDDFLAKYPHELSGGQRQRVSFARALAARPSVLLADEPVSMLDVSIRLEMLNLLNDLRQRFSLAMLYITHDIASARYFADEILVMYAGEIVERGPAEEVTQFPAHPYTQLLVASAPDPDNLGSTLRGRVRRRGPSASGRPQNLEGAAAEGCPFNLRCPFADDQCRREDPALTQISDTRGAACWHLDLAAPDLVSGPGGGAETTTE
jgi:peptide/nickel transport system ATP-binding protein